MGRVKHPSTKDKADKKSLSKKADDMSKGLNESKIKEAKNNIARQINSQSESAKKSKTAPLNATSNEKSDGFFKKAFKVVGNAVLRLTGTDSNSKDDAKRENYKKAKVMKEAEISRINQDIKELEKNKNVKGYSEIRFNVNLKDQEETIQYVRSEINKVIGLIEDPNDEYDKVKEFLQDRKLNKKVLKYIRNDEKILDLPFLPDDFKMASTDFIKLSINSILLI